VCRHDLRVFGADLVSRPVFLVHELLQIVQPVELVEHIRAHEIGVGYGDFSGELAPLLCQGALENLPGQQHARGFAANFALADTPLEHVTQVGYGEHLFGYTDVGKLVADHPFDQHDLDLFQMVVDVLALVRRYPFVQLALLEEQGPGGDLRVKGEVLVFGRQRLLL
jgi:hypothetical protein